MKNNCECISVCLLVLCQIHVSSQGLIQGFKDFAMLNQPETSAPRSSSSNFPSEAAFPSNQFPTDPTGLGPPSDPIPLGTGTPFDPFPPGSGTPSDPFQPGIGNPSDTFPPGTGTPFDPVQPGTGTPFDPFSPGTGIPSDSFPPGNGTPSDPFPPGTDTPFDPVQPSIGTPFDPVQPGIGTASDPFPPGIGNPSDPFPPGTDTPFDPVQPGIGTPSDPFPPGTGTPSDPFSPGTGIPSDSFPPGTGTLSDPPITRSLSEPFVPMPAPAKGPIQPVGLHANEQGFPSNSKDSVNSAFTSDKQINIGTELPSEIPSSADPLSIDSNLAVDPNSFSPNTTLPVDSGFQGDADFPTDSAFPVDPFAADPFAQDSTSSTIKENSPLFRFLPSMPTGNKFINLNTGTTNTFQPTDNWMGDSLGAANLEPNNLDQTVPLFKGTATSIADNTNIGPIVPSNEVGIQAVDQIPIQLGVVGQNAMTQDTSKLDPVKQSIELVKQGTFPAIPVMPTDTQNTDKGSSSLPVVVDSNVIPLGPAFGTPVILNPSGGSVQGPDANGNIPNHWMQLYPRGRQPSRRQQQILTQQQKSEAPQVSATDYLMAQASLNSFSKNRGLSKHLREERRRARRQRKLEKQRQKELRKQQRKQQQQVKQQIKQQQAQLQQHGQQLEKASLQEPATVQRQRQKPNQQRKLKLKKQNQNKKQKPRKNSVGQIIISTGPQGAKVARMVLPGQSQPFVGKKQRGRGMVPPCTRRRQALRLCSPGTLTV